MHVHDRKALRDVVWAYLAVLVLVTAFVRVDVTVSYIGHVGGALVAVVMLYAPVVVAWRRGEDLYGYGFRADPVGRGLGFGLCKCWRIVELHNGRIDCESEAEIGTTFRVTWPAAAG